MSEKSSVIVLEVISPERTLVRATVDSVELPGSKGRFVVLKDDGALDPLRWSGADSPIAAVRGRMVWTSPPALWKSMTTVLSLAWNCDEKVDLHIH